MRSLCVALIAGVVAVTASVGAAATDSIKGEYLEARNADVWTGPCFANGEVGIVGNKATLAWKVTEGTFDGVRLDGLSVVAVVIGDRTFGLVETREPVITKSVLIVDDRATPIQRVALVAMARKLAGKTIQKVLAVQAAPIRMETGMCEKMGCAMLEAGDSTITTRCLCDADVICGHETISYPPLAKVQREYAAYSLEHAYAGKAFGETFEDSNARSALLAAFSL